MADGSFYGALIILTLSFEFTSSAGEEQRNAPPEVSSKSSRGGFAPRMYYDDWTPLGHGDPLKHDPTYDYVPPVLDHVHYWEGPIRTEETSLISRQDPPDLDTKPRPNGFPVLPEVPPTMLVPPPPPVYEILSSTQPAPTTLVEVEPVNMVLHSSTTVGFRDFRTPKPEASWRAPNSPVQVTTLPTLQTYGTKERPFTRNSLYHQSPPIAKPTSKSELSSSIPIQQGQPFRLSQGTKTPVPTKPIKKVEEKESLASLLQSLLDDVPTTTESSVRFAATTPAYTATTTPPPMTTGNTVSHFTPPPFPVTAPLYLIIQGHSKVKTYGVSKAPSLHSIPPNQLGDSNSKVRFSRQVELKGNFSVQNSAMLHVAASSGS